MGTALVLLALVVLAAAALYATFFRTPADASLPPAPPPTYSASAAPVVASLGHPAVAGDVDGDGRPDEVRVEPGPRALGGGVYDAELQVRGTRAGVLRLDLGAVAVGLAGMHPVDVDGKGFAQVPVQFVEEAAQKRDELVALTGDQLALVRLDGRAPLSLPVGSGRVTGNWDCIDSSGQVGRPGLVEEAILAPSGSGWSLTVSDYSLQGAVATQVRSTTSQVSRTQGLSRIGALHRCGSLG
ncbi:MAG TPA: hypothetical protein VGN54_00700 [Mycobacteriales bacterium]|nr:hypothetical protein [Mycobacteriales bacterium]